MTNNILYCVLNWGLGHASRSVPIIQDLLNQGHKVSLASDGIALDLLKKEFPDLRTFELHPYDITYKYDSIVINLLSQSHKLFKAVRNEKQQVAELVEEHAFDQIISDNRFGCYHKACKNIIITHQIRLLHRSPFIQASGTMLNMLLINKFDECWVPDYPESPSLSGKMSHNIDLKIPINYIGPQSRFSLIHKRSNPKYKSISILSGPEPQRSMFQEEIVTKLRQIEGEHLIVTGRNRADTLDGNIFFVGLKDLKALEALIENSEYIISRSGYSSLMDFESMKRKSILVPTPGQSEQEYLAMRCQNSEKYIVLDQNNLTLKKVIC